MPAIKMLSTHASADCILHEGKTYLVDAELAQALTVPNSGRDGNAAATIVKGGKSQRVTKPDPGESETPVDDDDATD